ncbi:MAG: Uma2 family endonuclease [Cyanobacteria bacterium]|jgi:Uma2 family endonuclease|nr:Uma2 family endonuclease [Cyanobacteria bacterium GSL.Bin1]
MNTYTVKLQPIVRLDDEQFLQLSQANPDLKFERSQQGNLIIMSPTGGKTGNRNAELIGEFIIWNRRKQLGQVFDSSTGFKLANGAIRSPDVAWVKQERWNNLSTEEKRKFPNLAPDFVLELRSETDSLTETQAKLREYIENGVRLGWLINPLDKQVEIYHPGKATEVLDNPQQVSGEEVLPEFTLDLSLVWE